MKLIDADALIESIEQSKGKNSIYAQFVRAYTKDAPTMDAVPVVRCKDCKHWYNDGDAITWCNLSKWACGGNGFCLYAERKDNE